MPPEATAVREGHPSGSPACCSGSSGGQHPSRELRPGCRWRCSAGNAQLHPCRGAPVLRPGLEMCGLGPSYSEMGVGKFPEEIAMHFFSVEF